MNCLLKAERCMKTSDGPGERGRLVLVTGGSRGIGYAISQELLISGFSVHLIARNDEALERAADNLGKDGPVTWTKLDLSERRQIEEFAGSWARPVYGLVNNAGMWSEERLDEEDTGNWSKIIDLNLSGTYWLTKKMCPFISTGGRIVNISSQLGSAGRAGLGAYSASKHGVIGLTHCWALELAERGITVNAVCPGWIRTESNLLELADKAVEQGRSSLDLYNSLCRTLLLGRFIEPQEVACLVSFLLSTKSSGISGQIYHIK
jgi:NAD(P)-dependent dehydrogenase (short-subunit alcohol dehydrogenase family)